jgi:hypothetical protein
VPVGAAGPHTIDDASGLDLFDSGLREPGSSFTVDLPGAGSYATLDAISGNTGAIGIPVGLSPASGGQGTTFTVAWAVTSLPPGLAFDVQIERPGSDRFVPWLRRQSVVSATFRPDAGPGIYAFRARLAAAGGAHASWSPAAAIEVT